MEEVTKAELQKYMRLDKENLSASLVLKDQLNSKLKEQVAEREAVIDAIAEYLGLQDKGLVFYNGLSGKNRLLDEIKDYLSKRGDKVKLKKRIAELENENSVLRTLIQK